MKTMEKRNMKPRAVLSSFIFSIILMIFPVVSGIIVTVYNIDIPQRYWIQGVFMLFSITVPIGALFVIKIPPSQIAFVGVEKDGMRTTLYFIPIIVAKIGFLFLGINHNVKTIIALAFFTMAIGLSEEIYFRGMILRQLRMCFSVKQAVLLSSMFFAAVHISQAFSGVDFIVIMLNIVNAFIFGIVVAEITVLTGSLIPAIILHTLYNFVNWSTSVSGKIELVLIVVQSLIMIAYGINLWNKLSKLTAKE